MVTITITLVLICTTLTLAACRSAGRVIHLEEEQELNYLRSRR